MVEAREKTHSERDENDSHSQKINIFIEFPRGEERERKVFSAIVIRMRETSKESFYCFPISLRGG